MAFDWLSFGAGIAEGDMAGKQAEFEQALVNFREDKKLVNTLAADRYSRKINEYDKEVAKLEKLESAYVTASKLDKTNAAHVIAAAEQPELYKILTDRADGSIDSLIASYTNNFKDTTNEKGEVTGFTINRKDFILNEPKQSDFFKGKDFWDKESKNIQNNTTSFLGNEIRQLFNKEPKSIDNKDYLAELDQKSKAEIKSFVGEDGKALPDKVYTSTVVGDAATLATFNFKLFKKQNPEWIKQYNKLDGEIVWKSASQNDNFLNWMSTSDLLGTSNEANFELKFNDTQIEGINESARAILSTYKAVYNEVVKSIDAKVLAAKGVDITELRDFVSLAEVNKQVQRIIEERYIKIETGYSGGTLGENPADFIGTIPITLIGIDGAYTLGDGRTIKLEGNNLDAVKGMYKDWILDEAEKIKGNYKGKSPTNSALASIQKSVDAEGKYLQSFKEFLDGKLEKALPKKSEENTTSSESTNLPDNQTGNEIKVVTENGVVGITNGNSFISFEQLESENKIDQTLQKYPYLKSEYEKYKGTSVENLEKGNVPPMPVPDMMNPEYFNWIKKYGDTHNQDGTPK